jgi:hypothetical protein
MNRLDEALRKALRREDPGPAFTAQVLARAAAERAKRRWWAALAAGPMRWAAAGALATLLVVGGTIEHYREQRVREQGQAAKQQLMLALRIAGGKLNFARQKVQELNEN